MSLRAIEQVEPGILQITWEGHISPEAFKAGVYDRIRFADEHGIDRYVLVYDLREAVIPVVDVRLSRWAAEADPRLLYVFIVGRSRIAQAIVAMLAKLMRRKIEFVNTLEEGIQRARQILQQQRV
jgi:hypothetical protein